ncbi:cell division protein ZapA, partial [Salmonella enterica]
TTIQINAMIMGQSYTLACQEGEQAALHHAVAYLDQKMRAIRDAGRIKGTDRIAVMAGLGIAAELLSMQRAEGPFAGLTIAQWQQ